MPPTVDAYELTQMYERGEIKDCIVNGPLSMDLALSKEAAKHKGGISNPVIGAADIILFPNIDAGNIAYKLVQRFAHADAFGPVLQGLAAPINDLSRGCFVMDIVNLVAITANQAHFAKKVAQEATE